MKANILSEKLDKDIITVISRENKMNCRNTVILEKTLKK